MYEIEDQAYLLEEVIDRLNNMIRIGKVCEVGPDGRVKVKSGDITTDWLDIMQNKAGESIKKYSPPEPYETVLIVSPMGDLNQGLVIPGLFTKACSAPKTPDGKSVSHEVHKYIKGSEYLTLAFKPGKFCIENQKGSLLEALANALTSLKSATAGGEPLTFADEKFDQAIKDIKSFS